MKHMQQRPSRNTPEIIKKLREDVHPKHLGSMLILGLNVPLSAIKSENDLQRVIVFLNKSLINSREEFDMFLNEVRRLNTKNVELRAHIMKNLKKYKEFDPEVFNLIDD